MVSILITLNFLPTFRAWRSTKCSTSSGISPSRSRNEGTYIGKTFSR
jgi:hypothetical protein